MIIDGHRSDSTNNARSGFQWSRKRAANCGRSTGENWWITSGGSRFSATPADVTVPEVTSTLRFCARTRSISGKIALISPTLAP